MAQSTATAPPVAPEAPPPSKNDNATRDVAKAVHTETSVPDYQVVAPEKLMGAQTVDPHPTSQAAPVVSATSGPLDNNPALEYTEIVDSSNTAHAPYNEHEAIEDPPFATPMEAPQSAGSGQVARPATAEKGTKTT